MKKAPALLVAILWLSQFSTDCLAQEKIKFRKIPTEDLKMASYGVDSLAPAVILFDKGVLDGQTGKFTRHVRIKVLSHAGTSFANFTLSTPSRGVIDGSTYNISGETVTETPLEKENIFTEELIPDFLINKVFFPNVKPGSVVELRYSFNGLPFEWRFQERIPVRYSELILEPTKYIVYKTTMFGSRAFDIHENYRWVATSIPAFVEEPHMSHYSNYITHFKFDIERIFNYEISSTWRKVAQRLIGADSFGGVIRNSAFLKGKANQLKALEAPEHVKIDSAINFIRKSIKWNGVESAFASRESWSNYHKDHSGNSAEINLLLIALLNKMDINTYPAVLSTRDNGKLSTASASMRSINYVVACVIKDDQQRILIDATSEFLRPGILPERCLNTKALLIKNLDYNWTDDVGGVEWIDTNPGRYNTRKQFITIDLDDEIGMVANVSNTFEDYDYLNWIQKFQNKGSEDLYARSRIAEAKDVDMLTCETTVDKNKLRATEKLKIALNGSNYLHDLGGELLINPFVLTDIQNPFREQSRTYPIDFIYPRNRSIIVTLKIPDTYVLRSLPQDFQMKPDCGGAKFSFMAGISNNVVNLKCTLTVDQQQFEADQYAALKNFFSEINRRLSESIILDKKS